MSDTPAAVGEQERPLDGVSVLLLTSSRRSFFDQQVDAIERLGADCRTVAVPARDGRERGRGPREYLRFAARALREGASDVDLVHVHYGLIAPVALAQPTRPVVVTLWGSDLMGPDWLAGLSRSSARFSDAVVVPSMPMSDRLATPHDVVPFGVDTALFRPIDRAAARERVGWDPDDRVVLFPYAPDRPVKNYPLAQRVVDRVPNATLRPVSGVAHDEIPYYLNASDALLVTSERESGPMVIREAAACNVPVVSRDVGFARDVLDGVAPSVVADDEVDLAAGLTAVLDGPARSNGRETVDELSVEDSARRLATVYRDVLG